MNKKCYKNIWLLLLLLLMVSGCVKKEVQPDKTLLKDEKSILNAPEEEKEPRKKENIALKPEDAETKEIEVPEMETAYLTDDMYAQATSFMEGDLSRLVKAMKKAESGEEVTIAVIGGSITEGYSASSKGNSWAAHFYKWWMQCFPDTEINYVNAGIGGTSSYLGVHRVQEDVLSHDPDVVVIEFSVNDSSGFFYKKSYDNLVRRILKHDQDTAVILLFTTQENRYSAQGDHALIGYKYKLPMLSYGNAIWQAIDAGDMQWKDISPDIIHPNDKGHAIIGEIFYRYLNGVYERVDELSDETIPFDEEAVTKETYLNAEILDANDLEPISYGNFEKRQINPYFENNWHTQTGEEALILQVEASHIGLIYQREVGYGQFDVFIDGTAVRTIDGDYANGFGKTMETVEVYASDETKVHTIEIKKNPDSAGTAFTLVGLMISQM